MSPRRSAGAEPTVKAPEENSKKLDAGQVRKWEDVAPKIKELREAGATVPEICEKLDVSYVLVNQLILQSYKMVVRSAEVFERQEKMRLGIE